LEVHREKGNGQDSFHPKFLSEREEATAASLPLHFQEDGFEGLETSIGGKRIAPDVTREREKEREQTTRKERDGSEERVKGTSLGRDKERNTATQRAPNDVRSAKKNVEEREREERSQVLFRK